MGGSGQNGGGIRTCSEQPDEVNRSERNLKGMNKSKDFSF